MEKKNKLRQSSIQVFTLISLSKSIFKEYIYIYIYREQTKLNSQETCNKTNLLETICKPSNI